jgi:hypothetical protein
MQIIGRRSSADEHSNPPRSDTRLRTAFEKQLRGLIATEEAVGFDPARNDALLAALEALLEPAEPK